jgi:hypothetical protein
MMNCKTILLLLISVSLSVLTACTPPFLHYGDKGLSRDEFARYVESVFRLQNNLTSQTMLLEDVEAEHVLQAEQKMHTACAALNDYASKDMDGLSISLSLSRRVEQSAAQCEKAALQLQTVLDD